MRSAVETNLFRIHSTGVGEVETNVAVNLAGFPDVKVRNTNANVPVASDKKPKQSY